MGKNYCKLLLVLILVCSVAGVLTANDFAFYSAVQKFFRSQGLHVSYDHMSFIESGGGRYFMITIESRRTDMDRVMLVGFYASGLAIRKTKEKVEGVNILLTVSKRDGDKVLVEAKTSDILELVDKKISTRDFVGKRVNFY